MASVALPLLAGAAVLGPAWLALALGRDLWPFSHYPMFSKPTPPDGFTVARVAIEGQDGRMAWWRPHFYKLQQTLGHSAARALRSGSGREAAAFAAIGACIAQDPGPADPASMRAACLVLRRCRAGEGGAWVIEDREIARHELAREFRAGA